MSDINEVDIVEEVRGNEFLSSVREEIRTSPQTYERMCRGLYAYAFHTISFLDLIQSWEQLLQIAPASECN